MTRSPTFVELRARVFKSAQSPGSPDIGNWLARHWGRPSALPGTWLAVRLGLSAHQITLAALAAAVGSALAIGTGTRTGFILGAVLSHLAYWLDHVDGQVARWRGTSSLDGVYFDYLMHHAQALALGFALGYGLAVRTGDVRWAVAGFLVALGWAFLSLQNDCRYKSFFQRLKKETHNFQVVGGAGGRPAPPTPWPAHGLGVLTWPLAKACEPHVVLLGLTALAVIATFSSGLWLVLWRAAVATFALGAPLMAIARATRTITRGSVESEFDRWFQTIHNECQPSPSASRGPVTCRQVR